MTGRIGRCRQPLAISYISPPTRRQCGDNDVSAVAIGALLREKEMQKVATRWVMANQTDGSFLMTSPMKHFIQANVANCTWLLPSGQRWGCIHNWSLVAQARRDQQQLLGMIDLLLLRVGRQVQQATHFPVASNRVKNERRWMSVCVCVCVCMCTIAGCLSCSSTLSNNN